MPRASCLLVTLLLASILAYGCHSDDDVAPASPTQNGFLRQIDHGCQRRDGLEWPRTPYDCRVVDQDWHADTLSIRIGFTADCCVSFVEDVLVEGQTIQIAVTDTLPECDCVCPYENEFLFHWQQPGEISLTFRNVSYFGETHCVLDTVLVVE